MFGPEKEEEKFKKKEKVYKQIRVELLCQKKQPSHLKKKKWKPIETF
jgi:hypothetical protein